MSKENVTRRISIYVNGKEVENSLKGVDGEIKHVRNSLRKLVEGTDDYDEKKQELIKTLRELEERQGEYREELGLTSKAMKETSLSAGGLRGNLTGIWDSLVSGDLQGAKEGISGLKDGMLGLGKATLSFLASPFGIILTGLAGLATGAKALFDYNKGLTELNYKLESLGVSAKELSKVRSEILATAKTFDKDFNDLAEKANSLAKSYDISISEANKLIAKGLADGGAYNNEFLDSIGEYDEFFAKAGYSAQEFINIVNSGYDLGIYQDKLPDALKEADLALRENTASTRDALVNAFGASFSDDILNRVKTGEITTKTALEEIALKAQESNLSQQQYAQLTADVFKGAGEDAGGAARLFEALGTAAKKNLGEAGKSYDALREANERLNKAQAELFEIKSFGDIWTGIKTASLNALSAILEYVADLKEDTQPLIDLLGIVFVGTWQTIKTTVVSSFDIITGVVKSFFAYFSGVVQFWKKILQGDFKGAFIALADGIGNAFKHIGNIFINLYNNAIKLVQGIIDAASPLLETLGIDVDKLQKKLEGLKGQKFEIKGSIKTETENTTTNTTSNQTFGSGGGGATKDALAADKKAKEQAEKDEYNRYKALVDAKAKLAKAQLDQYLVDLKSNIDKEKQLTPEILAAEEDRLDTIRNKKNEFEQQEFERKRADLIAKAELEKTSQEQLNTELETLNIEYNLKVQENDLAFQQQTDELKKQYEEQQKILKAEQLAIENELALAEAETKAEEDKLKREQDYKTRLAELKNYRDEGLITETEYDRFIKALTKQRLEDERLAELNAAQGRLNELGKLADATTAIFGQNKATASATALINGGLAVTEILKTPSVFPEPYASISRGIQITAALATTTRSLAQINSAKAPQRAKFFYGGFTGSNAALGNDEYGPITGYVHKNEYVIPEVMTRDPRFADTIGWLEQNRQQKLRGYVDGGETTPGTIPQNTTATNETAQMNNLLVALLNRLDNPIAPKLVVGYQDVKALDDMNNEIKQSNQNGIVG